MGARLRKVLRDLLQERLRALLVLVALTIGGWAVAAIIASTSVLEHQVADNFLVTNPHHARLTVRGEGDVVAAAESTPWVTQAEHRTSIRARARGGFDGRIPVVLMIVDDFEQQHLSTFELEQGRWPRAGEVVLERDDLMVLGTREPPETVRLQLPGRPWTELPVSGIVHDPGQAPARMEHILYIYAPRATALGLGWDDAEQDLLIRMAPPAIATRDLSRGHANLLANELGKLGYDVRRVEAPEPDTHPHAGHIETMFLLQYVFGATVMLLGGVVVVNMVSSRLRRHVAQVGVLKTVGATSGQVAALYMLMVFVLSVAALAVTLPLGFRTGIWWAAHVTEELNFDLISGSAVPPRAWLLFASLSLALPQMAAAAPIIRGMRVTVLEAIGTRGGGSLSSAGGLATARRVPIALRNAARSPARTGLTVAALAVGLGALASAFHVGASMRRTMEFTTESRPYDLSLGFGEPLPASRLTPVLAGLSDVLSSWTLEQGGSARRVRDDGLTGAPFGVLVGDPLRPPGPVVAGVWRLPPEGRAIILNSRLASLEKVTVGEIMTLRIDGEDSRWPVGGIVREIGGGTAYLLSAEPLAFDGITSVTATLAPPSREALHEAAGAPIAIRHGDGAPALATAFARYQAAIADRVEVALERKGIPVSMFMTKAELVAALEDHIFIMTQQIAVAALVIILVGSLGFASAMSASVLERTREIGVLRALGATPAKLAAMFAAEGVVIGLLSLVIGLALSLPAGRLISDWFGNMMFRTPLEIGRSFGGVLYGGTIIAALVFAVTAVALTQTLRQSTTAALRYE